MAKGIELPVNIIIILIIAMVVLVGVLGLVLSGGVPGMKSLEKQSAIRTMCQTWVSTGCTQSLTTIKTSQPIEDLETLEDFCLDSEGLGKRRADGETEKYCRKLCGC